MAHEQLENEDLEKTKCHVSSDHMEQRLIWDIKKTSIKCINLKGINKTSPPVPPHTYIHSVFPDSAVVKNPPTNAGDAGWIPGSGRFPGEGNSNPLYNSCLRNPMDKGDWQAIVHGVTKESDTI